MGKLAGIQCKGEMGEERAASRALGSLDLASLRPLLADQESIIPNEIWSGIVVVVVVVVMNKKER
jgi:hypothetical protein